MEIKGTHQYPKIYALGSVEVVDILKYPVEVTEKVDGSQIGFAATGTDACWQRSQEDGICHHRLDRAGAYSPCGAKNS